MVTFVKHDLEFILNQILYAEAHVAASSGATTLEEDRQALLSVLPNSQVPFGLRTVDGTLNNLVFDQADFGAADTEFPRLVPASFNNEGDEDPFFGVTNTDYSAAGNVVDSDPRTISNLIVDQTANNPAAVAAALANDGAQIITSPGLDGIFGTADDTDVFFIPNVAPDEGLSASFNGWMTFFGQFFDHGLDLVNKGGNGTIFMPLQEDDPLFNPAPGAPNFLVLTRATLNENGEQTNDTTPFIDQNQTYTSHSSHQVFVRAYEIRDGVPVATGELIENRDLGLDGVFGTEDDIPLGGMATWGVVKAQARDLLGIELDDQDALDVPLLAADQYGNFIPGTNGLPQIVVETAPGVFTLIEGDLDNPIDASQAVRTGHAFLADIAHNAAPVIDNNGTPDDLTDDILVADADNIAGNPVAVDAQGNNLEYDDELLDEHFIAGDGRVNENIALTAVHHVFHAEHNRLVEHTKAVLFGLDDLSDPTQDTNLTTSPLAVLNGYLDDPLSQADYDAIIASAAGVDRNNPDAVNAFIDGISVGGEPLDWNGERLFQAAKFGTEMQYQHLVFEEFARKVQPLINIFGPYDSTIDASIVAEFAHAVYRFGHSMLTETVDRFDEEFNVIGTDAAPAEQIGLIAAFLNPLEFDNQGGLTPDEAAGAIVRGMTRVVGNEIDEFVTEALRNNLLGLPLDLAAINIARGRDTGVPTLNAVRQDFYEGTNDPKLKPYDSWVDFALHAKNPISVINFIAAYGTHDLITGEETIDGKRAAAWAIVTGESVGADGLDGIPGTADDLLAPIDAPADRLDFLNSVGTWADDSALHPDKDADGVTTTGLGNVDLWIGGLAEAIEPFGGMLGSTFAFVFENQMEQLQDGDRFYYLTRTAGLNFLTQLEQNSFADMISRHTDAEHLPGDVFSTPTWILEVDQTRQLTGIENPDGPVVQVPVPVANASFEADSLADDGAGPVNENPLGNFTFGSPTDWTITGGTGGLFAPVDSTSDTDGHSGPNVVFLHSGATLSQDTGQFLVEGAAYTLNLNVGDRTDQAFPGGTARLLATDGVTTVLLASAALPTPVDNGGWANVSLSTPAITADLAGFELRVEVQQAGGGNQILVDDVQITRTAFALNGDPVDDSNPFFDLVIRDDPSTPGVDTNFLHYTGGDHVLLGGTDGDDTLIGGIGDDTLWGDAGNDRLESGPGADIVLGGAGDDIITDSGGPGPDNLQGQDGNDVISAGPGEALILGGAGKDFILGGPDIKETFGGLGDDIINAGDDANTAFGNEGDDWLEGGAGSDGLFGDNGDPFETSAIIGNDVFFGGGGGDGFDGESGDDIMVGAAGSDRNEGMLGFDWVTYKNDELGVEVDMTLRAFDERPLPPSSEAILDRFERVEGLSGSKGADILRGDDRDALDFDAGPTPGLDHMLRNFDLIDGLRGGDNTFNLFTDDVNSQFFVTEWGEGEIILGGDGSDILEGREGNEIIDGDLWLNVRLSIRESGDPESSELATVDTMQSVIEAGPVEWVGRTLSGLMLDGTINPSQLHITREILTDTTNNVPGAGYDGDFDTVQYSDILANYTIEGNGEDVDGDGFITISHNDPDEGPGLGIDGVDKVRNVERLRFSDQSVVLVDGINSEPVGQPIILGDAEVGQTLEVQLNLDGTLAGVTDADNAGAGAVTPPFIIFWQVEEDPGTGVFIDIIAVDPISDEDIAVTGPTFLITEEFQGLSLRVRVLYQDDDGVLEEATSAPTDLIIPPDGVGVVLNGTDGADELIGTEGADVINGLVGNDAIEGLGGDDIIDGGAGADEIEGGDGNDTIFGGNGADDIDGGAGADVIEGGAGADSILGSGGADQIFGEGGTDDLDGGAGADIIFGGANPDTILGGAGQDELHGDAGADEIDGGDGQDLIFGGAGADEILGGAGNDTIFGEGGADIIDGGVGQDDIDGGAGNDTLTGGAGADNFIFTAGFGTDTIADFQGNDLIDLSDFIGLTIDDLDIVNNGADSEITSDVAGFGTIIVLNTPAVNLDDTDFTFGA